jgi:hypothetical protein
MTLSAFLLSYGFATVLTMAFVFDFEHHTPPVEWLSSFAVGLIWWFYWPFQAGVVLRIAANNLGGKNRG